MSTALVTPPPAVSVRRRADGCLILQSPIPLPPVRKSLAHIFDESAAAHPQRTFMCQRISSGGEWRSIAYSEAQRHANGLAQWLIDQGYGPGDSVAYLSSPSIEHGIVAIGAQRAGVALAPLSVAYSLLSSDHRKLRGCVERARARVVIVDDAGAFGAAMKALEPLGVRFVAVRGNAPGICATSFAEVVLTPPTAEVARRTDGITANATARIMYTSGSTGTPKATPQAQSNLTITVAQMEALGLLDFGDEAPRFLEAMPFSHIMAGNFNFNNIIRAAGTMYIDEGKPTPALFHHTIANLHEVSPHFFITVPLGYAMLCDAMEADDALRDSFFRNLRWLGFGGAMLPESVQARLLSLSRAVRGFEMPVFSFYGATEYLFGTIKYWPGGRSDIIGLPPPGTTLKLRPVDTRYELLVDTPTLMPRSGYLDDPVASANAFDEEGYFRSGDAVAFADPERPEQGLVFAGRIADDFKLSSGTFVGVNRLRADLIDTCSPLLKEVVLCGLNRDWVSALVWLDERAARQAVGVAAGAWSELLATPEVQGLVKDAVSKFNAGNATSSRRIGSLVLLAQPLSFDLNELTDKGNASPTVVRARRAAEIELLYADGDRLGVLRFPPPSAERGSP